MSGIICDGYKIGSTVSDLVTLQNLGVAIPDQVVYRPASVYYTRADFSRVGDGFASIEWIWDTISISRLSNLLAYLGGDTFKRLYIVTDKRDGTYPNTRIAFAMFDVMMWKPVLSGEEGVSVAKSTYVMQTVKIQFVDAIELTGYI